MNAEISIMWGIQSQKVPNIHFIPKGYGCRSVLRGGYFTGAFFFSDFFNILVMIMTKVSNYDFSGDYG